MSESDYFNTGLSISALSFKKPLPASINIAKRYIKSDAGEVQEKTKWK